MTQVTLVVTNQQRALDFYTEKVGFEKKNDVPLPGGGRWVSVGPRGQDLELALWPVGAQVDPQQRELAKAWAPGKSPPILVRVTDCRKAYDELHARGVPFLRPPTEYPWGVNATFSDPDGNLFSLSQPPG